MPDISASNTPSSWCRRSPNYLLGQLRSVRLDESCEDSPMKYAIMSMIRLLGLLSAADRVRFFQKRAMSAHRNRQFLDTHPGFVPPPADLAFDAYSMVDWAAYHDGGLRHARVFADAILSRT